MISSINKCVCIKESHSTLKGDILSYKYKYRPDGSLESVLLYYEDMTDDCYTYYENNQLCYYNIIHINKFKTYFEPIEQHREKMINEIIYG